MIDRIRMKAEPPGARLHIEVGGGKRVQSLRERARPDFRRQRGHQSVSGRVSSEAQIVFRAHFGKMGDRLAGA